VTLADPRVAQPSIQRQYLVPSYSRAKPGEAEALDVLAHVLGNGQTSRLHRKLVVEDKLATSAAAWYPGSALDSSKFGLWASPRPGVELADLEAAIDRVLAELVDTGVTGEELARAKTRLVADTIYAQDSQTALARIYGVGLTTGSTVEDVKAWPERVKAVTAAEVQAAAKTWLDKRRAVTGYLVKAPSREHRS
jgi:zinc protease